MATTTIFISRVTPGSAGKTGPPDNVPDADGLKSTHLAPSAASVAIVSGDIVTFTAGSDAACTLYFSPAAIVTPPPTGTLAEPTNGTLPPLAAGASLTFTFRSPSTEGYGVVVLPPESGTTADYSGYMFAPASPPVLFLHSVGADPKVPILKMADPANPKDPKGVGSSRKG
jgi:hypothetical protein